jgi:hypothetical protein
LVRLVGVVVCFEVVVIVNGLRFHVCLAIETTHQHVRNNALGGERRVQKVAVDQHFERLFKPIVQAVERHRPARVLVLLAPHGAAAAAVGGGLAILFAVVCARPGAKAAAVAAAASPPLPSLPSLPSPHRALHQTDDVLHLVLLLLTSIFNRLVA